MAGSNVRTPSRLSQPRSPGDLRETSPLSDRARGLDRLARQARWAALRSRGNAIAGQATTLALFPTIYGALALTLAKLRLGPAAFEHSLAWGALVPVLVLLVGVGHAALRHGTPFAGALALDRHHGLRGRITNALAFAALPDGRRTPMMEAAIDDALASSAELSPRRAVPFRAPRDLAALAALVLGATAVGLLEVPVRRVLPSVAHHVEALAVSPDDLELFRRVSEDLQTSMTDAQALAGARRFNQLIEDLAERRLDRREIFRRLDELEQSVKSPAGLDASALDEALDGLAKELDKSPLSRPVAEALAERRLADAEQAMRDLAKKVEGAKKGVDQAKLEALRQALKKAGETVEAHAAHADSARRETEERRRRLLEKQQKEGLTKAEQQELDRAERKLEHLDREKSHADAQQKALSGLDKDLQKAAQDLMKDLGMGSKDLHQGAEDINRAAQQKMSEKQKEELRRRIEELRQILRQEGQAGRDRLKRMMAFGQRARGGQGEGQGQGQKPGSGAGQGGQGQGQQGGGQDKGGKGRPDLVFGSGRPGEGSALVMGPGGAAPGAGQPGQSPGGGGGGDPETWGAGHDPNVRGDATRLKGQTQDVTAAAADTGQGAASSQVIYGAAERGFIGRSYKKVYTDYQTVAEESLAKDEIPAGYRFYVRRYFELIRPRD